MVVEEWQSITLGEFVTLQRGHDLPEPQRRPGKIPILGSFGITGYHDTATTKAPGVTVGRSGASFGVVNYSSVNFWALNTALYVNNFHGNDEHFAYYFLKSIDFKRYNSGSAQPSLNRNFIHPIPIKVPSLPEQKAIAHILGSLDDKIELNRQMNQTLEAMAKAIFKSWFVDFDPVRARMERRQPAGMDAATAELFPAEFEESALGLIPKGWRVKSLDEIAHFLNGLALQKYPPIDDNYLPVIKIAELRKGVTSSSGKASLYIDSKYIIQNSDIIFSWSGSLTVCVWNGSKGALNQHLFKVTSAQYPKWFYYQWIKYHLPQFQEIAASKATTMGHIQRHHLKEAQVVVPAQDTLRLIDKVMEPLLNLFISHNHESRNLASIRDTLLPKLLSGQIRIKEAEKIVEEIV